MKAIFLVLFILITTSWGGAASGKSHGGGGHHASSARTHIASSGATPGVQRDKHGRIARSQKAKDDFRRQHPCPSTGKSRGACPDYVIDHVTPLKRGGTDRPSNMQWQTTRAAKEKDKTE